MSAFVDCGICCAQTNRKELYCYGFNSLKKADSFWYGNVACLRCQEGWIKRHTVVCCDCGNTYVTVNVGVARRCEQCGDTYNKKVNAVSGEKKRTKDKGLPSTMNRSDWIVTLNHFGDKCAYCGGIYEVIEHFTPVKLGGGTTASNCVPACPKCNSAKRMIDGRTQKQELAECMNIPVGRLIEIEKYLISRRGSQQAEDKWNKS